MGGYLTEITLNRLSETEVQRMAELVAGGKTLPSEIIQQVSKKTDGIPLFVEEMTKMILESGQLKEGDDRYIMSHPLPQMTIPATIQDMLMARLDKLAPAKDVAQLGATVGREFPYELLRALSPLDDKSLNQKLDQLVKAELLYQRGKPPQARYLFKHALIQDAAYQSLLKSKRQQYHQKIAQVLTEKFPDTAETQPELLAHHYTKANLFEQAIPFWQKAGQQALQRSANLEAISHLNKGLELVKTFSETPERIQQELSLQMILGPALMAMKGWAAPEVEAAYTRVQQLCRQIGEAPQLYPAIWGLWAFHFVRQELRKAYELGEQLLRLAVAAQNPDFLLEAHMAIGNTLVFRGEFTSSVTHHDQALAIYDPQKHSTHAFVYGQDPAVVSKSWKAQVLWRLGYPDQGLVTINDALALSQDQPHPFSQAFALSFLAMFHLTRREWQAAEQQTEAGITLSTKHGFPLFLAACTVFQGAILVARGQEHGIAQMLQGIAGFRATGAELLGTYFLSLLATGHAKVGQVEEGLTVLDQALTTVNKSEERYYEAELHRIRGALLLSLSEKNQAEAEACFHRTIDIARKQQAKSFELRAAMSLSRLWQKQDKQEEARQLLTPIYNWFTEGFGTQDLKDAKALLDELS
jgi:predicted ATPase